MGRNNFYPFLALPSGSQEIFVFGNEMDGDQNNRGIYGQKISATGDRVWTDNGKSIIEISQNHVLPFSVSQAGENMVVFFDASIDVISSKVKAMCLDTDGNFVWENDMVELSSVASAKVHIDAGNLLLDQWVIAWEDDRNGAKDIYAQNIQLDGTLGPVEIQGEIEVNPDTLFYEVNNPLVLPFKILNNSTGIYTLTEMDEFGIHWGIVEPLTSFPYNLLPGDSLIIEVEVYLILYNQTDGYVYENLNIMSEVDTHTVVIAMNEDLFVNISKHKDETTFVQTFPNPSNSIVTFDLTSLKIYNGILNISDQSGRLVRQFNIPGKNSIIWDRKNENNQKVIPGTYFYQLISDDLFETGKLIILE